MTGEQLSIAQLIVSIGRARGEMEKTILSALETGWVESRFHNLTYGDRDSLGVMQQRPSQGWGTPQQILDPSYAINAFYDAASRISSANLTAGQLAQRVQRSAFPERYDQAESTVISLLGGAIVQGGVPGDETPVEFQPRSDSPHRVGGRSEIRPLNLGGSAYSHAHCG